MKVIIFIEHSHISDAQAFSHFSYLFSGNQLMLVDVQGVQKGSEYMLTDPAFHTIDGVGYGETNLGEKGMESFLKSHTCSPACFYFSRIVP
jgi:hypothetical protein